MIRAILAIGLFLVTLSAIDANSGDWDLILLPETTSPGGRCMDGTMSGYYIRDGDPNFFVIYLKGGGACRTKNECDARNGTDLGGSANWSNHTPPKEGNFQSTNCDKNPGFCNATAVFVPYCTGDTHRGSRDVPSNETWGYYFDGHLNFKAMIETLIADNGLAQTGNKVLFTGGSAGGVGTLFNIDWLANRLPGVTVKGVPTAGWFFPAALETDLPEPFNPSDYPHFANGTSGNDDYDAYISGAANETFDLWKVEDMLSEDCLADFEGDLSWFACSSIHYAYPYINSSLFNVHTQYDGNHIYAQKKAPKKPSSIGEADTIERYVEMWGQATRTSLQRILNNETNIAKPQPDGIFAASCITHGTTSSTYINGMNYTAIVYDWFFEIGDLEQFYRLIETCPSTSRELPCNEREACKLVIAENRCSIAEDIYNKTFYIPAVNYCWRVQVFENGTLEADDSDPTCSNTNVFNSIGVFSIFDYSDENIAYFKVGDNGYSGSFAFKENQLADEQIFSLDNWNQTEKEYVITLTLPSCSDPTSPPSVSPSMIPSEVSFCPIEYVYNTTLYVSAAGACWRVQVFDGGTLEADFSDPSCLNTVFNSAGEYSTFQSGSGNSAYFEKGDRGFSGTFSFEQSASVSEQDFELVSWNSTAKEYDIIITFPDCTEE